MGFGFCLPGKLCNSKIKPALDNTTSERNSDASPHYNNAK